MRFLASATRFSDRKVLHFCRINWRAFKTELLSSSAEMTAKALALLSLAVVCAGGEVDYKIKNDPQCKWEGEQCNTDLTQIIYCTGKNGNSFVVTTCGQKRKCQRDDKGMYACRVIDSQPSPDERHNGTAFNCHGSGIFPDAYDCHLGYMCTTDGEFPELICRCPDGSALVMTTKLECTSDESILDGCSCPYKDRCRDSWNPNNFGSNCRPGYFYMCNQRPGRGMVAEVYKCPHGQIFFNGRCQLTSATLDGDSFGSKAVGKPTCTPYEPPCEPDHSVKCSKAGELIPHRVKRCYYLCDRALNAIVGDCGKGSYFSTEHSSCVRKT